MFVTFTGVSTALLLVLVASSTLRPAAAAQVQTQSDSSGRQSPMNIAFDLPDLITTVATDSGTAQLVAYKSTNNDRILVNATASAKTPSSSSSQLFWVSIGVPKLIRTPDPQNRTAAGGRTHRLFHFNHNGFSAYVQMMTSSQRQALAATARSKYTLTPYIISGIPS